MTDKRTQLAVVLFCDVVGSTVMRVGLGDDVADRLNSLVTESIRIAIEEQGGKVIKGLGDGFMAIFDSTVGAVAAGVEMHIAAALTARQSAMLLPGTELALRVGISAGEIAEDDGDYFGTPVVEAARLVAAAQSHEVLVSDLVRALIGSRGNHQFELAGDYTLKGLPLPVTCYRVPWTMPTHTSSVPSDFPESLALQRQGPFVGREALLGELREGIDNHRLHTLLLYGEPGIGKTRLVAELAWQAHENRTSITMSLCEQDNGHAYGLWIELLRSFAHPTLDGRASRGVQSPFARLSPVSKRAVETILSSPTVSGVALSSSEDLPHPTAVAEAIGELFSSADKSTPTMIIVDDLQWADAESLAVLRNFVKHRIEGLTTVLMYCDRDITDSRNVLAGQVTTKALNDTIIELTRIDGVRREELLPLEAKDVTSFVAASFAGTLGHDAEKLAAQIFEETEGNPMFVAELLHDLASRNPEDLDQQVNNEGVGLPQRLRETIHRRIARLGEETLRVLSFAAVIGRKFDIDVLEAITESDALDDLDLAEAAGILTCKDSGSYEFSHVIIHEALLAELSATRRARIADHIAKLSA
jgi:class 3 adenylate cyclase